MRPAARPLPLLAMAAPAILLMGGFFVLPVVAVALDAFSEGASAFARVIAMPRFLPALAGSLLLTLVAVSLSVGVGLGVALHLSRLPERQRPYALDAEYAAPRLADLA